MDYVKPGYRLNRSINCLRQNLIRDEVAWDQIENRVIRSMDVLQESSADHEHLEATRGDRISPPHERIIVVALNDRRTHDYDWQISAPFLDHALCETLRKGVSVRVDTYNSLLLLINALWAQLHDILNDLLTVLPAG